MSYNLMCVNFTGGVSNILCGIPQDSELGPILFLLYCTDVTNIAEHHGVTTHSYADDTQTYFYCKDTGVCDRG